MKILFIIPGSGDAFYCGNCFRDNLQASALRKAGHDVIIMPLYLPFTDASFQADTPLFFSSDRFLYGTTFLRKKENAFLAPENPFICFPAKNCLFPFRQHFS
ncbi:MAG: hypothetical protein LIP06_00850 [Tannerellaceae bacterium]|nr:hypothetical protein [Tannerellaceae bacterium]